MTQGHIALLIGVLALVALVVLLLRQINFVRLQKGLIERKLRNLGMTEEDVALGEARVHLWLGPDSGPPLLMLHGFGASAMWQFHPHLEALTARFQVIMPDLLWFGGSSSTGEDYSLDYQVETIRRLLDHLEVSRTDVVAISYGGFVAYELGAASPERVGRTVLIASPGREYTRGDYRELCRRFEVEHISQLMLPVEPKGVQKLIELASYRAWWTPRFIRRQALRELFDRFRQEQSAILERMIEDADVLSSRSTQLEAETLLIWGRHDPVFPLPLGRRLADQLGQRARLEIIDEAKHAPTLEHPRQADQLIVRFLTR